MTEKKNAIAFGAPGIEPRWTSSAKDGIGKAVKIARLSFFNTFRNAGEMKPDPGVSGNRLHDATVSQPRCAIGGAVVGELALDFLRTRQIIDFSMGLALRARLGVGRDLLLVDAEQSVGLFLR